MYKFYILKTYCFKGLKNEMLETFHAKGLKKGLEKVENRCTLYINNGTVNDFTSFAKGYMSFNGRLYGVSRDKLRLVDKVEVELV